MRENLKSESEYREVAARDLVGILLKYIPEDRVRAVLDELGLLNDKVEDLIVEFKARKPKITPIVSKDPLLQREFERLYVANKSLQEYIARLEKRLDKVEKTLNRLLNQLSLEELLERGDV